jgi:hypothetical protein
LLKRLPVLLTLIAGAVVLELRAIVFGPHVPAFSHDWTWPIQRGQLLGEIFGRTFPFTAWSLGGYDTSLFAYVPIVVGASPALIFDPAICVRIALLSCLTIGGIGAYRLALRLCARRPPALAIALLYVSSPVVVNKVAAGQLNAWVGLAALPFALDAAYDIGDSMRRMPLAVATAAAVAIASQPGVFVLAMPLFIALAAVAGGSRAASRAAVAALLGAGTQIYPAVVLVSAAKAGQLDQLLPRLPWQMQQSPSLLHALSLDGYFASYFETAMRGAAPAAEIVVTAFGAIAIGMLVRTFRDPACAVLATGGIVAALLAASMHDALAAPAAAAFLQFSAASIFRELYNFTEIVLLAYVAGAAYASRSRTGAMLVSIVAGSYVALALANGLGDTVPMPALEGHVPAALRLAAQSGDARIYPVPNGRFLSLTAQGGGGFDPFAGTLGAHPVVEDYFSSGVSDVVQSRPYADVAPLLQTIGVGYVWQRTDFRWTAPGFPLGAPRRYTTAVPAGPPDFANASDRIWDVAALPYRRTLGALDIVPDYWDAGLASLQRGHDFIFARDAVALGVNEGEREFADDRRFVLPGDGPVAAKLGDVSDARFSEFPAAAIVLRGDALGRARVPGPWTLLESDAYGPGPHYIRCELADGCAIAGTYAIVAARLAAPLVRSRPAELGGAEVLVVANLFDSGWNADLDGRTLPHLRIDGFANAWLVPRGESARVRIEPQGQPAIALALAATLVAWLAIVFTIARPFVFRTR